MLGIFDGFQFPFGEVIFVGRIASAEYLLLFVELVPLPLFLVEYHPLSSEMILYLSIAIFLSDTPSRVIPHKKIKQPTTSTAECVQFVTKRKNKYNLLEILLMLLVCCGDVAALFQMLFHVLPPSSFVA